MTPSQHRDRMGRTELHDAAAAGDVATVRSLVAQGADVDTADKAGWTALHFAAQAQAAAVAAELLTAGATADSTDEHGNTPLWRAVFCYRGDPATLNRLAAAGADPDRVNAHGVSPRALAARIANTDVAQHLPPGH
ncbi:ankyrin repeat domain-containing protein [Krasilnikovia sp. MM14-A1259]|uniref:ankyrin repeat domain-containing protein n=1 Tax=Krasilnikovia sp. MM14-A1259 TaxID=3373539 RepID=UPI00380080DE